MKKIFTLAFSVYFLIAGLYIAFEPEILQAATDDVAVSLTVTSEITLACDATAPLTGTINGISGGSAAGSFVCSVVTPDSDGYEVKVKEGGKLLTGAGGANYQFDDYVPAGAPTPDYSWVIPGAAAEIFGFSVSASTTSATVTYQNNGSDTCGVSGSATNDHCWDGFALTDKTVASKSSAAAGDTVKLNLKAEADDTNALTPGAYANTVTVTATAL